MDHLRDINVEECIANKVPGWQGLLWKWSWNKEQFVGIPKPSNDAELEVLSELYFGVPLHLAEFRARLKSASYRVKEKYDSYHGTGFLYSKQSCGGYDHSACFWSHVIGRLSCGGIAGHSYGQVTLKSHRAGRRLSRWYDSWLRNESGRLGKQFDRLARTLGSEREQGDSR